jgi:hypothetical protein
MSPFTQAQFLDRARSALDTPTLYWLGFGGSSGATPMEARPGTPIEVRQAFAEKQRSHPDVAVQYAAGLKQLGLGFDDLPKVACDCSGFVAWALGVPRTPQPLSNGWMNTDSIHADATGARTQFRPLPQAVPGALLVYPSPGAGKVGHVAIVTQVDAQGRALKIVHCAPENFLIAPAAGAARTSIAETGAEMFEHNPTTLAVAYTRFAG